MSLAGWIKGLKIAKKAGTKVADVIHRGQERRHGNVEKNAQRSFELDKASIDQFAKEFTDSKNWFDSLINGVNRLPRPLFALTACAIYMAYNSSPFVLLARGDIDYLTFIDLIQKIFNDQIWLLGSIIAFYFGGRFLEKQGKIKAGVDLTKHVPKKEVEKPKKKVYDFDALIEKHFSKKSKDRLMTCHRDLQKISAVACSRKDFSVLEGTRTLEQQQKYFAEGKSKLDGIKKKSKHQSNPSMAIDIAPTPINWDDTKAFFAMSDIMFDVASELKASGEITHRLRWGGDFNQDGDYTNDKFVDMPHWELIS